MKPYCHVVAILAVAIEEVRIVFELMNDARTRKIRVGSDFDVIRTSTRMYVRTYVRTIFFPDYSLVWGSLTLALVPIIDHGILPRFLLSLF